MRVELTVTCESDRGKPQTVTVTHDGMVIGMLLITPPTSHPSDIYVREQRDALAGMLLASVNAAYEKENTRLRDEARQKALDDAAKGTGQ